MLTNHTARLAHEVQQPPVSLANPAAGSSRSDGGTREEVVRLLFERGALTANDLANALGLSAAAIRRHLDGLLDRELIEPALLRGQRTRGRGRPAKAYALTDAGRSSLPHGCNDVATGALDFLRSTCGDAAVEEFAQQRADELAARLSVTMAATAATSADDGELPPAALLAAALSAEGYAASAQPAGGGVQLCQHHCPVAHVAAHVSELCDAETRAFERLLGTHVQRLATIANGDGICTTFVPTASRVSGVNSTPNGTNTHPAPTQHSLTQSSTTGGNR